MKAPKIIKQSFQVHFSFNLLFTSNLFNTQNTTLANTIIDKDRVAKVLVILDSGVSIAHPDLKNNIQHYFKHYQEQISLQGDVMEIPGGETAKNNDAHINSVLEKVNAYGIDRHSYIVVIGGGAVLDAMGFAAAISHRGVRLVRIPTTVLSQNDSGIGVKNGINFLGKKNFTGTFAVPYAVINDDAFLTTLDERDWRSGISEAIKVALIKDYEFFEWIEQNTSALNNRNLEVMNELIYRCADLHMKHIQNSGDAFEQGSSRPLDFGHWSAHKLEQLSNFNIRHGEAVAIGIALDSAYSYLQGHLSETELQRILDTTLNLGFSISYDEMDANVIKGLEEFREHLGGKLTIMLLSALGTGFEVHEMESDIVLKSIDYLNKYVSKK
ncbi:3-dehydroquinate synthase [Wenyingzhuangia heitensis]|uniref:3-dehydroquinate synthase n=1 Tax=Wenyingzhuangia heitensis TaxID=1487859 RepID=A0ABX0UCB4_9FLAO|nr:3-dehydroquinate synthase [Wenyingzhuangia heitensis]NIJ45530.1 3-dehydroquinate synthase [Wenyingzhuangia heitensis]